jgi:lysyl-tRNA synthetase class 2
MQMEDQSDLVKVRREKLKNIRKQNIDPYPAQVSRTNLACEIKKNFNNLKNKKIILAGRLVGLRGHGKAKFGNIKDESGNVQVYFKYDKLGKKSFEFLENIDLGDFLEVEGKIFKTHTGEQTLEVSKYKVLVKSLMPLPEKWHGISNIETKHRQRYLDLLANPEVYERFIIRSKIITTLRKILDGQGFIEIETPILQSLPGGASAKPFNTHHNALNQDLYLRIAPELYLKRLLIGGFEKIYEIGKAFRNEGVDTTHNPEFSILELYYAYRDYKALMKFIEELVVTLVKVLTGGNKIEFNSAKITVHAPFKIITYKDAVKKYTGIDISKHKNVKSLMSQIKRIEISEFDIPGTPTWPKLVDELFKEKVRDNLINPTFIINHPVELSPLSKKRKENPEEVERFQLYIGGLEMINGFSELNDPEDQRERFEEQARLRKTGDEEAMLKDNEFVEALEYGMPPTAGLGIGIDRLVMLLVNQQSIREVILFPHLRKKDK